MKEHPILFSGAMVRAILDGHKTQTRRIVKPQPPDGVARIQEICASTDKRDIGAFAAFDGARWQARCPYGAPGDRLWVRETWGPCAGGVVYRADDDGATVRCPDGGKWRPSIHMPRWASRITLAVEAVRVERLHSISEEEARAEGVYPPPAGTDDDGAHFDAGTYRDGFVKLWREINGAASWAANPWVWVVTFRRVIP